MQMNKSSKYLVWVTAIIILIGLVMSFVGGGIYGGFEFTGGGIMTVNLKAEADEAVIKNALAATGADTFEIRYKLPRSANDTVSITMKTDSLPLRDRVLEEIRKTYPDAAMTASDVLKPQKSMDLLYNAILTLVIAGIVVFGFMALRFGIAQGTAAIAALLYALLFGVAILSIFRIPLNREYLLSALLVAACSAVYSSLLFEKIAEVKNRRPVGKAAQKAKNVPAKPVSEIVHEAVSDVRTLVLVTAVALILVLCVAWYFTGTALVSMLAPAIGGIAACVFSTLFITGPVWGKWSKNKPAALKAKKS